MFSIKSIQSSREIIFRERNSERLTVELTGDSVNAICDVWTYMDTDGLNKLFQDLGNYEKPWDGELGWGSLEGDFSIKATCTKLGDVTFIVSYTGSMGSNEQWHIKASIVNELGQLKMFAKQSEVFFNQ